MANLSTSPAPVADLTRPDFIVGVLRETAPRERRVALDPAAVARLVTAGRQVLVETDAGSPNFADIDYVASGAVIAPRDRVLSGCSLLAVVRPPELSVVAEMHEGQAILGLLEPLTNAALVTAATDRGITLIAFELLPRTLSRAQSMDALSSGASAAGYRAAIVAAEKFGRYLPMLTTASGTAPPAKVLVIGAGVAGLQAIGTARRLGAVVTGYDVRAASRGEVESLGAKFLTSSVTTAASAGGYARPLTESETAMQQKELGDALHAFDIIITTAKVPGRTPPLLVRTESLATLRAGSVCVDLGASDLGGNVAGSLDGSAVTTDGGVIIVGAGNMASDLPISASQMYARNVVAVIESLAPHGAIVIDPTDEVHRGIVVTHDHRIVSPAVRLAMKLEPLVIHTPLQKAQIA